jgi:hypothetical protein
VFPSRFIKAFCCGATIILAYFRFIIPVYHSWCETVFDLIAARSYISSSAANENRKITQGIIDLNGVVGLFCSGAWVGRMNE